MKRLLLALCLLALPLSARAQEITLHPALPPVTVNVADSGLPADEASDRPYTMQVTVSRDGEVIQQFTYASLEREEPGVVPLAQAMDINFDGYADLLLLTAQGARNVYQAAAVYSPEDGRFDPVLTYPKYNAQAHAFEGEAVQLELCLPALYSETGIVLTSEADGYACGTDIAWVWEGRTLRPGCVAERYDAGEGQIGERVTQIATQVAVLWDEAYPETWYYGQEGVYTERAGAMRAMLVPEGEPTYMRVANVDWVNVRKQDSKSSEAVAGLSAGTEVRVLGRATGAGEGWVRVLIAPDEVDGARFVADGQNKKAGITGYIWQGYLSD